MLTIDDRTPDRVLLVVYYSDTDASSMELYSYLLEVRIGDVNPFVLMTL